MSYPTFSFDINLSKSLSDDLNDTGISVKISDDYSFVEESDAGFLGITLEGTNSNYFNYCVIDRKTAIFLRDYLNTVLSIS